jgi:geranylgeranyl transferase type-2 subunit beta
MSSSVPELFCDLHKKFIHNLDRAKDSYEFAITDQLRMSGARTHFDVSGQLIACCLGGYWGLSAMEVMRSSHEMNRDEMIQFVLNCRHPCGGFGGNVSHDPHLLYTLSAIQVNSAFFVCIPHMVIKALLLHPHLTSSASYFMRLVPLMLSDSCHS